MNALKLSTEYIADVGTRFKLVRVYLKLDQRHISTAIDTARPQTSKIESGRGTPTLYQLVKLKRLVDEDDYYLNNTLS